MPHKKNQERAIFKHITTQSGRDVKTTLNHVLPAGSCTEPSSSLPLIQARYGKLFYVFCILYFVFCIYVEETDIVYRTFDRERENTYLNTVILTGQNKIFNKYERI